MTFYKFGLEMLHLYRSGVSKRPLTKFVVGQVFDAGGVVVVGKAIVVTEVISSFVRSVVVTVVVVICPLSTDRDMSRQLF